MFLLVKLQPARDRDMICLVCQDPGATHELVGKLRAWVGIHLVCAEGIGAIVDEAG